MKTISCDDRRLSLIVKHSAGAQPNRAPYGKPPGSEDNSLMTSFIFNRRVITARALPTSYKDCISATKSKRNKTLRTFTDRTEKKIIA